ncbi:MAG TPA: CinA family protein [Nocardioides sp.]|nr:CinA family protein [Nocardioides sp.]
MSSEPAHLVSALTERGLTVATAESLTGGQVAAALTGVPGSSKVYAGGVVTYATRAKVAVLGVPEVLVDQHGVVSGECAAAMAEGARQLLDTDLAVSTTGVAGPEEQEGKPVGTVFVGVASASGTGVTELSLSGDRVSIQQQVVDAAVGAVLAHLGDR